MSKGRRAKAKRPRKASRTAKRTPKRKLGTRICTSISADTPEEMAKKASAAFSMGSDLVEFRVDTLAGGVSQRELERELSKFMRRAVMTVRAEGEGGSFHGSESQRLDLIARLAGMRPAYLDVELSTARSNPEWVRALPKKVERIVSWHDFSGTPALKDLKEIRKEAMGYGALAKVVTTARTPEDNLAAISLCDVDPRRTISFCMGDLGAVSRVVAMRLRSPIAYAALPGDAVAPGQLAVSAMKALRGMVA